MQFKPRHSITPHYTPTAHFYPSFRNTLYPRKSYPTDSQRNKNSSPTLILYPVYTRYIFLNFVTLQPTVNHHFIPA